MLNEFQSKFGDCVNLDLSSVEVGLGFSYKSRI
eukprot:UN08163